MVQEFDIFGVFHCLEKGASNGKKNTFYRSSSKWNKVWVVNRTKSNVQPGLYKIGNTASQMYVMWK